ncbi:MULTISPECIES: gluconate 2-dehydrogenase subunit 3 family protein [unclassified Sphingomonas]|uniref:gluconate 2-dehydrogenase subunit 3 family protein n=1 Tax=unclassified Sphingomonas TaxID=196159 RepID=UPI000928F329|nr:MULTISPECIES: gluconate 2-dehydrogenase subunit 3 family protein [unclassified Sphingomonas]OJU17628.1 MAG: transcriptional initiation protein Tat [Sphingomonas sp. 66-10]
MIDRRAALAGVIGLFGAQVFAPIARAAATVPPTAVPVIADGPPSAAVFTPAQRALMAALSERVIPTTDTPGALAAGVPDYIEKLLADWALPEDRVPIVAGLDAIEARSISDYGVSAVNATPAQQDALLALAMNNNLPAAPAFFELFRQLVITGYYTSEIGMTQEREYLPVPGEYDGAFLYSKINKVYSA